jgi:hypothetical protein
MLSRSGWRTIEVRRGDMIETLWPQAGRAKPRQVPSFAALPDDPSDAA